MKGFFTAFPNMSFISDACIILDFSKVVSPAEAIVYSFSWITADSHLL